MKVGQLGQEDLNDSIPDHEHIGGDTASCFVAFLVETIRFAHSPVVIQRRNLLEKR